ncbi:hypothetical protein [Phage f2b1]|nr:hypothetical protein [Phage f2b1]
MLKDLFTEKRVPILNNAYLSEGDFITFVNVNKEHYNENGDYKWVPDTPINGIVYRVTETVIQVATVEADYIGLYMDCIVGSPTFDEDREKRGSMILGIMKNAIPKEDK